MPFPLLRDLLLHASVWAPLPALQATQTPLMLASQNGNVEAVVELLKAQPQVDDIDKVSAAAASRPPLPIAYSLLPHRMVTPR